MSTTSPILNLTLPASDGSDPFSLADDFLNNWAILDASPGVLITAFADLPTLDNDQIGRFAFVTDFGSDFLLVWAGVGPGWQPPNAIFGNVGIEGTMQNNIDMGTNSILNAHNITATGLTTTDNLQVGTGIVTNGFEIAGVNFFVTPSSPVGVVTSIAIGDIAIDIGTPALWMSTVAASDTDWTKVTTV